jgi:hypothetical protein
MCPACLATLAMAVTSTAPTGGLVLVLANRFCFKRGAKKESRLGKASGIHPREKSHAQGSREKENRK